MRILFALAGLHRIGRGAETAFIAVASELAKAGNAVTLIGSGQARADTGYGFRHAGSLDRTRFERYPSIPILRNDTGYEELTFMPGLFSQYRPADFDITVTCSYPFTNWMLRRPALGGARPAHVFVTQNGDWPAFSRSSEFRFFGCDGLICTNPDFYARTKDRWLAALIPNGVDCVRFSPGPATRQQFGIPDGAFVVLMVSALIPSKRVEAGIEAVSQIPGAHLVVAGDGPSRDAVFALAAQKLPGRFTQLTTDPSQMPSLYRSADVFLHLSKEESFGNVYIEALACGLPVVAEQSERLRWIVGDNEFLLDTSDPSAIARHIEFARDAPAAARSARLQRAASFSAPRIAAQYQQFFAQVLAAKRQKKAS